jgi:hypothetical protein
MMTRDVKGGMMGKKQGERSNRYCVSKRIIYK